MAKMSKSLKLQHAKTHLERYTAYYRTNPTSKNRRMKQYYTTRVKNLKGK